MKKIRDKQKIIILVSIIILIVIIGIVSVKLIKKSTIERNKYFLSSGNENSKLVASVIKKGITIGGITGTLESLDTSDANAKPEDIRKGKTAYVKGEKITGTRIDRDMLEVGDIVEYIPDIAGGYEIESQYSGYSSNQTITQENFIWKIMSINNDGTVDLIADRPAEQTFNLVGGLGYNNVVYFMNDICKRFYSNSSLNVEGRALNINDIHNNMSAEGIAARDGYVAPNGLKYGEEYSWSDPGITYPAIFENEIGMSINNNKRNEVGALPSDSYYTVPTTETTKSADKLNTIQTTYTGIMLKNSHFKNIDFYNLIFIDDYTLASRTIYQGFNSITLFSVASILLANNTIWYNNLWQTEFDGNNSGYTYSIKYRPVVTLKSNVKFVEGDGTKESPYKLLL